MKCMPERWGVSVILFRPSAEDLERLGQLRSRYPKLVVVDNSEQSLQAPPPHYETFGENRGIGAALNRAAEMARLLDCDWLLTLDQDSEFPGEQLNEFRKAFDDFPDKSNLAIFAPTYNEYDPRANDRYNDVDLVMTMGNLLNLEIHAQLGGFNEELFIDEVDHEYCLRAKTNGYRVVQTRDILLRHVPGTMRTGRNGPYPYYPTHRLYTMTRNTLYLARRYYRRFPAALRGRLKGLYFAVKSKLLDEPRKLETLCTVLKGWWHNLIRRYGPPAVGRVSSTPSGSSINQTKL